MQRLPYRDADPYPEWSLLLTWVAVVQAASVSGAAQLLGLSQAAVSQRIKQLEAALSTELLDRSTRPARPRRRATCCSTMRRACWRRPAT
ncbi:LysR family transcriptional regulator [Achromobacter insuavis]